MIELQSVGDLISYHLAQALAIGQATDFGPFCKPEFSKVACKRAL